MVALFREPNGHERHKVMGIRIIPYRDGYRPYWYADYKENGKVRRIRLTERVMGVPPPSLSIKDEGSVLYEKSKARAQAEFADTDARSPTSR